MVPWATASGDSCRMRQHRHGVTAVATATVALVVMALLPSMSRIEGQPALGFSLGALSAKASAVLAGPRVISQPSHLTYAAAATASGMDTSAGSGSPWHVMGCAALLLAAAARRMGQWPKSRCDRGRSTMRACVVFSQETQAFVPINMQNLDSHPSLAPTNFPQVRPSVNMTNLNLNHVLVRGAATQVQQLVVARRVGQQRHQSNRHARKAFGQRSAAEGTSRRRIGARLQQSTVPEVAVPASFDPSQIRRQIQVGLRAPSQLHSVCRRESRTASSSTKIACRGLRGLVLVTRQRSSLE
mmetsp:Transcript_125929/g.251281  ORF Transcript_125929/g.251281 Transcript_125929/m.251281 type:complete len:299 (-) Transcript_125929:184-1080(-)